MKHWIGYKIDDWKCKPDYSFSKRMIAFSLKSWNIIFTQLA